MATRVGVEYISMIMLNCATQKPPVSSKNLGPIYYTSREMANLVLKFTNFRNHGNKGWCGVYFNVTVKLHELEYPVSCKNFGDISYVSRDIANFVLKLANLRYRGNKGRSRVNFHDTVKLRDLENPVWCKNFGNIS